MSVGIERYKDWANPYFQNTYYTKEVKEQLQYDMKKIPIGITQRGRIYSLDLSESLRILMLGMTRSGKTWIMRALTDRLHSVGYDCIYLPDVKDEFKSSRKPLQKKFHKYLLPQEIPQLTPVATLRPTFFNKTDNGKPPSENFWYSPNIKNLTHADFMTLLNAEERSMNQQLMLQYVFEELQKKMKNPSFVFKWEILSEIAETHDSSSKQSKNAMKMAFQPLLTSDFYIPKHERNLYSLFQDRFVPSLNMNHWTDFARTGYKYSEVTVASLLRETINLRKKGRIKQVFIMVDEASRFIPVDKNPSVKRDFMESVDVDTRFAVNYVFATQNITKIPEEIVKQCKYLFVPHSADLETIKTTLYLAGLVRNIQTATNDAIRVKQSMKKHDWLIINRNEMRREVIRPLAPLSWHMETVS